MSRGCWTLHSSALEWLALPSSDRFEDPVYPGNTSPVPVEINGILVDAELEGAMEDVMRGYRQFSVKLADAEISLLYILPRDWVAVHDDLK